MNEGIQFRVAEKKDAADFINVIRAGLDRQVRDSVIYGCSGVDRYLQYQMEIPGDVSSSVFTVATANGTVIGAVELRVFLDMLFLNYISVLPDFRSKGVARMTLAEALRAAYKAHHKRMELDVLSSNEVAKTWYSRMGFAVNSTTCWWDITPEGERRDSALVIGYPQARLCQANFGFSEFTIMTQSGQFTVGQLGDKWYRLTNVGALLDPAVMATLRHLDGSRRILALLPEGHEPEGPWTNARMIARFNRMAASIEEVANRLDVPVSV